MDNKNGCIEIYAKDDGIEIEKVNLFLDFIKSGKNVEKVEISKKFHDNHSVSYVLKCDGVELEIFIVETLRLVSNGRQLLRVALDPDKVENE